MGYSSKYTNSEARVVREINVLNSRIGYYKKIMKLMVFERDELVKKVSDKFRKRLDGKPMKKHHGNRRGFR